MQNCVLIITTTNLSFPCSSMHWLHSWVANRWSGPIAPSPRRFNAHTSTAWHALGCQTQTLLGASDTTESYGTTRTWTVSSIRCYLLGLIKPIYPSFDITLNEYSGTKMTTIRYMHLDLFAKSRLVLKSSIFLEIYHYFWFWTCVISSMVLNPSMHF